MICYAGLTAFGARMLSYHVKIKFLLLLLLLSSIFCFYKVWRLRFSFVQFTGFDKCWLNSF